jgi:hypothetical protein
MTGNPRFPNPIPPIAQVDAAVATLAKAQTATLSRTKGAVATRNTARATVRSMLQELKAHVQAAADADPENSVTIIQGAGMTVRKPAVRAPRVFAAKPGPVAGSVTLVTASAARRASYEWEYSTDGGKTWVAGTPTLKAKTQLTGLPSATSVEFRVRTVTKAGASDWSPPVSLLVK